jgi:hypothetical protein
MPVSRGLVSGVTSIRPSSAAMRWAPALMANVSSVQVSPARKKSTGTGPNAACGGTNTPNFIGRPISVDACR